MSLLYLRRYAFPDKYNNGWVLCFNELLNLFLKRKNKK